jgi:hypothetical protein
MWQSRANACRDGCLPHITCHMICLITSADPKYQNQSTQSSSGRIVEQPHVAAYHNRLVVALITLGYIFRWPAGAFVLPDYEPDRTSTFRRDRRHGTCFARAREYRRVCFVPPCLGTGLALVASENYVECSRADTQPAVPCRKHRIRSIPGAHYLLARSDRHTKLRDDRFTD